jgi:hypothetical protein
LEKGGFLFLLKMKSNPPGGSINLRYAQNLFGDSKSGVSKLIAGFCATWENPLPILGPPYRAAPNFSLHYGGGCRLFACLELIPPTPQGIRGLFSPTPTRTELFSARVLGAEFLRLEAQVNRRGKPDWDAVARLVRPLTPYLLAPAGCQPPKHLGFAPPVFTAFERRVLLQCACDLINGSPVPLYRRRLGVYDPAGEWAEELLYLLHYYTSVRVVTQNLRAYQMAADLAMEELRALVLLGEEPSDFSDCILLLCPGDVAQPLPLLPACPVLAGGIFADFQGCNVFSAPRVSATLPQISQLPRGSDLHTFAGAVFHSYGYWLPNLRLGQLLINGKESLPEQARYILLREAGILTHLY